MKSGRIIVFSISPNEGLPKYPEALVKVAEFGFEGDYHCKPMRKFSKRGTMKPNIDRHVTIVAQESLDYANDRLGIQLGAGNLGENVLTQGLGDLSEVIPYTLVQIGRSVLLKVIKQNKPCGNLAKYHPQLAKTLWPKNGPKRRGLLCAVIGGIGEIITPADQIILHASRCLECGYNMYQQGQGWKCNNCGATLGYDSP